jgi:hypothetical protein
VTTFNRPEMLRALLDDLHHQGDGIDLRVDVYDDGSSADYGFVQQYQSVTYHRRRFNGGKPEFWQLMQYVLDRIRSVHADYYINLQDDVRLVPQFFRRAMAQFAAIQDQHKICLNLHVDPRRAGRECWTRVAPIERRFGSAQFWQTQWCDLLFIAERRFFEALDFRVQPVSRARWEKLPELSSGVGEQWSWRLHRAGYHLYQVRDSLVKHGEHPSQLHRSPLKPDGSQRVLGGIATIPERTAALTRSVRSILPQLDELHVYLNGFSSVPAFLQRERVHCYLSQDYAGDLSDAGKFWAVAAHPGYFFALDDDLLYPPDYVSLLIEKLDFYERQAVLGLHGIRLRPPVKSYFRDRDVIHFASELTTDTPVHLLGTGTVAFHGDTIRLGRGDFPGPHMADIWLALAAHRQRIGMRAIARPAGWLRPIPTRDSLFQRFRGNDEIQTTAVQAIEHWTLWAGVHEADLLHSEAHSTEQRSPLAAGEYP